jgi:hypothetical protein
MKKTIFFILFIILLLFNVNGYFTNQAAQNSDINNEKSNYKYISYINKENTQVDNSKIEKLIKEENVNILKINANDKGVLKEVYFPKESDFNYLNIPSGKELSVEHYYSTECKILDPSCSKINYSVDTMEYRYIFSDINKELFGNYYISFDENKKDKVIERFAESGYTMKIENNSQLKMSSERLKYKELDIVTIILQNILSIFLFVFISSYIISMKSKKIGIQLMMGENRNKILSAIVKDYLFLLAGAYVLSQSLFIIFLVMKNQWMMYDFISSIFFLITLMLSIIGTLILVGYLASKSKIINLIKSGFKATKSYSIFNFLVQLTIFTVIVVTIASAVRLVDFKDQISGTYSQEEFAKYQNKKDIVPFSLNPISINSDEKMNNFNSFLDNSKYGYISSLSGLSRERTGDSSFDIFNKIVYTNREFLEYMNFNQIDCEDCILIGNSRKGEIEKDYYVLVNYIPDYAFLVNSGSSREELVQKIKAKVRFYDDSQKVELRQFRLSQDVNENNYYQSPILVVSPEATIEKYTYTENPKNQESNTSISYGTRTGVSNYFYFGCKSNCDSNSNSNITDLFIKQTIEYNSTQHISSYTDVYSEAKQVRQKSDSTLFFIITELIKALLIGITIIIASAIIKIEAIKKKIAINFMLGNGILEILKDYIFSITLMFFSLFIVVTSLNESLKKSGQLSYKNEHIYLIVLAMLILYTAVYYFGIRNQTRNSSVSDAVKGDI